MKLYSWNVNGIRAVYKRGDWQNFFLTSPDILCIQETKAEPEQLAGELRNPSGYYTYFSWSKGRKGYSGTAIYSKVKPEHVEYGIGIPKFDDEGRIVIAHYKDFVLCNVYFPNGGGGPERLQYKYDFYDAFLQYILQLRKLGRKVIFCGDVNTAHEEIDLARPRENVANTGFLPLEREWVSQVISCGFLDSYRILHPTTKDTYSYWDTKSRARERNVGWRIDYFFVCQELLSHITRAEILMEVSGSDHCPVLIDLQIDK